MLGSGEIETRQNCMLDKKKMYLIHSEIIRRDEMQTSDRKKGIIGFPKVSHRLRIFETWEYDDVLRRTLRYLSI